MQKGAVLVLVDHDPVETDFIRDLILVVVAVVEIARNSRIEQRIGQR
jgi:hypothetical protein